jgi:ppGpp synthetase/RelA/SpoT-type nucleotidyltranferase
MIYTGDGMAWATPDFSRSKVDSAGEILGRLNVNVTLDEYDRALRIFNNWRSAHSYPLQVLKMTLLQRAQKIDPRAVVAQRLKRLRSVRVKLAVSINSHMKLSQMQDIGGARAIMPDVKQVRILERIVLNSLSKNPAGRPELSKQFDYIAKPKRDGYRGVHLVFKYRTKSKHREMFNGLRIEIQLRSKMQHVWATAVEIVSALTGQALKSKIGSDEWKRFFALMGSVIAIREKQPLVPDTPIDPAALLLELRALAAQLKVEDVLRGGKLAIKRISDGEIQKAAMYLLVLDVTAKTIRTIGFAKNEMEKANDEYLRIERESAENRSVEVVLVSAESIAAVESGYPNYYVDTNAFLKQLHRAIDDTRANREILRKAEKQAHLSLAATNSP